MTNKSAGHKSSREPLKKHFGGVVAAQKQLLELLLIILITAAVLCIYSPVFAGNPKNNSNNSKPDSSKPEVKLPVFKDAKDIKFDEDDQKFFVWLNKYFPEEVAMVKVLEHKPKEFEVKFRATKSRFRRLWKGYKECNKLGEAYVVEVKLRWERNGVMEKYKAAEDTKNKESLHKELEKVVSKEFDIAMEIKRIRYEGLRARIEKMKNYLVKRDEEIKQLIAHKDAEIKKRIEELLKEGKVDPNWRYPKNKGIASMKGPSVKLPVLKDVKFTEEDQKFFAWLSEFFPDYAQDLKDLEKKPKEFVGEFNQNKEMFRRLWRGYKYNRQYGVILVDEVKLRVERFAVLNKLKTANENQKAKLQNELNKIVPKEFEVAVRIKKNWYNGLMRKIKAKEKELAKRENEVKKLVENKAEEVKKRVKDLITGEEKINWN